MDELRELYQEVILDHSRRPRNFGELCEANCKAEGHNPLCGDEVTLSLLVEDGVVSDLRFEGSGCAISMAAASTMTETAKGRPVAELRRFFEAFHSLVTGHGKPQDRPDLGKLLAFGGVAEFPVRIKCATLPWHTLIAALDDEDAPITTED